MPVDETTTQTTVAGTTPPPTNQAPPPSPDQPPGEQPKADEEPETNASDDSSPTDPPAPWFERAAEQPPAWLEVALAEQRALTDDELKALPPEAHYAIAQAFADAKAAKERASAAEASAAEAARKAAADAAAAKAERAKALDWRQGKAVQDYLASLTKKTEGQQPDPSSPEGIAWLARKQIAEELGGFFKSLEVHQTEQAKAAEAAVLAAEYDAYAASIGDFAKRREAELADPEVAKAWREFMEAAGTDPKEYTLPPATPDGAPRVARRWRFDADKALDYVLAARGRAAEKTATASQVDEARRRVQPGSGVGRPKPVGPPDGASTDEQARWYQDNPDAVRAALEEARKTGALA